jgi:thiol-disulfide isomerase/thioredoxin
MNTNTPSPGVHGSSSMKVTVLNVSNKSTSDKLEKIRAHKNHHIITLFYRDGCPPCDKMKPEWKQACEMFKQKYACKDKNAKERTVIANVDDKGIEYLDKVFHKIEGTPTILYMSDNNIREYNESDRTAPTFLKWFEDVLKDEIVPANSMMMNTTKGRSRIKSRRSKQSRSKSRSSSSSSSRSRKNMNGGHRTSKKSKSDKKK